MEASYGVCAVAHTSRYSWNPAVGRRDLRKTQGVVKPGRSFGTQAAGTRYGRPRQRLGVGQKRRQPPGGRDAREEFSPGEGTFRDGARRRGTAPVSQGRLPVLPGPPRKRAIR